MIVTFYSFKGGVGRSFSLLETAAQLAGGGASVVVWDLDLEAPGLQKSPALAGVDAALELGTLDLLGEFLDRECDFPEETLAQALVPLELPRGEGPPDGRLDFLLPGKLDGDYPARFAAVDWGRLFAPETGPGSAFFYDLARRLDHDYDYVLIDSRTGFTDLSGVCTLQLPDLVVLVFNLNEQNLAGLERVHSAVTGTPARRTGTIPAVLLANMVPDEPRDLREAKLASLAGRGLRPHVVTPLHPELLLSDEVPTLAGRADLAERWQPLAERVEKAFEAARRDDDLARQDRLVRARGEELEALRLDEAGRRPETFEERVSELFQLLGYRTALDHAAGDLRFDVRLEMSAGPLPTYALVDCRDRQRPVAGRDVRDVAARVEGARAADAVPYQAIVVARSGFTANARAAAAESFVRLTDFDDLLLSLVDLEPALDAAVRSFQGTALERLYVEQEVVLQSEMRPGETVSAHPLTKAVRRWIEKPSSTFLTLLGDFGSGKTSFCRRLACELALQARDDRDRRRPVLLDLRRGASSTVTLENLLSDHFQRLAPRQPFRPQALLHLNREGRLVLFFDGFDETIAYTEPGRFVDNLRQILRAAGGRAKVIMTCRTHYFRDRPEEVRNLGRVPEKAGVEGATPLYRELEVRPGIEIGYLREFTSGQIDRYLEKALPPPADWREFRRRVEETYNLRDLAERPFLLEMIVKTLPRLRSGGGGEVTLADLYEEYCEGWFRHTDFRLTLTREHKEALVEYLARMLWDSDARSIHYEHLYEKCADFFSGRSLSLHDQERVDYEVRTALFLHRDAEGHYAFMHRSFLEFFVARGLRRGLAERDPGCLDLRRLTREVAFFVEFWPEAEAIPELAGAVLSAPYERRVSENALALLYFHARARLGPLVGPDAPPDAALARLPETFAGLRPERLELAGADLAAMDLRGADLSRAGLEGADLSRADLRDAVGDAADLRRASLPFADLRRARFEGARLDGAGLDHADARRASFRDADLRGADLRFGRFRRADLRGARLAGAADLAGAGFLDARGALGELPATAGRARPRKLGLIPQLGHTQGVSCVAWSPAGDLVASGSDDGSIRVWDVHGGRLLETLYGHAGEVRSVAWDGAGQRLASAAEDHTVRVWDAEKGELLHTLEGHQDGVLSVVWEGAGQRLASAAEDHTVRVWDAEKGELLHTLEGHQNRVLSVVWDGAGQRLASASSDHTVRVWDAEKGELLHTLEMVGPALAATWSPGGGRLAGAGAGNAFALWDLGGGAARLMARLYPLPGPLAFAATPDGHVHGPPEALDVVRFADGWALYDLNDLPDRRSPAAVAASLRPASP